MWAWTGDRPACLVPSQAGPPTPVLNHTESEGATAGGDAQGQLQGEELSGHCTLAWWH